MKRGGAIAAVAVVASLAAGAGRADPPPPLACLPPRAASCDAHPKKDRDARARAPTLRPTLATMVYLHTHEAVAIGPEAEDGDGELVARLLRDRTSWEPHAIDPACVATVRRACAAFAGRRVELVSGYRSDKLNEMLRKKGHQVARHSEHSRGQAVDFRIVGVPTRELYRFARREHRGGVGFYPNSGFVHVDVGRERTWRGD